MNRFFRYGGIVASIILIAFGIGSIVVGLDGRNTVPSDLAREQIVGTPDSTIPNQLVDTGSEAQAFAAVMRKHTLEATGRSDLRADGALPRHERQADERREAGRHGSEDQGRRWPTPLATSGSPRPR